jgi:peptidoglycan/LPS O-acetylase OafA/YrhL
MELDGLRAISVLFVVGAHTAKYSHYFNLSESCGALWGLLAQTGVQIFFIISGFIITKLLIDEHRRTGRVSLKGFYIRRFFRIIPAFWTYSISILLLAALGIVVLKEGAVPQVTGFIVSSLFLSDIFYPSWFWGHTWSLSVEEQFYVCFPLIFALIYKSRHKAVIMPIFLILVYISAFFATTFIDAFRSGLYLVYSHFDWNRYLGGSLFFSYQYIATGVSMAIFWKTASSVLGRLPLLFYILVIANILSLPFWNPPEAVALLRWYTYPILLACLVGWVMVKPAYFGLLRWPVIQFIGASSYSVYLWQQLFTGDPTRYGPIPLSNPLISLFLLFLCATLSYHFVERKFIALGRRLSRAKSPEPAKVPLQAPQPDVVTRS